ncbi:hypothetical protein ACFQ9X_36320 [Catenulispora yoronensis]
MVEDVTFADVELPLEELQPAAVRATVRVTAAAIVVVIVVGIAVIPRFFAVCVMRCLLAVPGLWRRNITLIRVIHRGRYVEALQLDRST